MEVRVIAIPCWGNDESLHRELGCRWDVIRAFVCLFGRLEILKRILLRETRCFVTDGELLFEKLREKVNWIVDFVHY